MRVVAIALVLVALCGAAYGAQLPPGFNSANDVANILANEPAAARFVATSESSCATAGTGCGETDSVTFSDSVKTVSSLGGDDSSSEFDGQIEQIDSDMKKLEEEKKEAEECAKRAKELDAEIKGLKEQKDRLQREKDKASLQSKLEKQMKDLNEINEMSRSLRNKFNQLKRTQQVIKSRMTGTRATLNQLDSEPAASEGELADGAENIASEVDALHKAQNKLLSSSHKKASKTVEQTLKQAHASHKEASKEE
jgi:DNA repair exonuclease SbcCD ATPase subunit